MIPRLGPLGSSFKGAGLYYLHDKDALTSERVGFTHTENLPTQDPDKALKWMMYTSKHGEELKHMSGQPLTGAPCSKPVATLCLAWHPEETPPQWHMIESARAALAVLDLSEHEVLMVAHNDEAHAHIHCIVNTVNPNTGKVNTLPFAKMKLSRWAEAYEKEHGKVYCDQRVENNARRDQGEWVKYQEPELDMKSMITQIYKSSDSGKAFQAALEEQGYQLARGRRFVLIDPTGKIHSLLRQIDGQKPKDVRTFLAGLDLPEPEHARGQQAARQQERERIRKDGTEAKMDAADYADREAQDRQWLYALVDAAIEAEKARSVEAAGGGQANGSDQARKPMNGKTHPQQEKPGPEPAQIPVTPEMLNTQQDRHTEERGALVTERQQARDRQAHELNQQYGVFERGLRRDAAELEQTLQSSGRIRLWWLRLTRRVSWDTERELADMRRSLENVEMRRREAVSALEIEQERRRQEMEARQATEKALLYAALERQQVAQRKQEEAAQAEAARRAALVQRPGPTFDRVRVPSATWQDPQRAALVNPTPDERAALGRPNEEKTPGFGRSRYDIARDARNRSLQRARGPEREGPEYEGPTPE